MADIEDLERRLSAAMDRIGVALDAAPPGALVDAEMLALAHSERDAARVEAEAARAEADGALTEVEALKQALEAEAMAAAQLRARVDGLSETKDRQAARIAELERQTDAVEAARSADRAELDALIAALEPLVKEQRHA
ncbi:MAG: hypothetical protein AAGG09_15655 [Pseudomonadota bacterium]